MLKSKIANASLEANFDEITIVHAYQSNVEKKMDGPILGPFVQRRYQ